MTAKEEFLVILFADSCKPIIDTCTEAAGIEFMKEHKGNNAYGHCYLVKIIDEIGE